MKILIVDDQPKQLKLLRAIIESEGFAVLQAADGLEALQLLESEGADAIISDILMPRMDGYRLCYEVRKSSRFRGLPIIIYTSTYTTEMDEKLSLDLGADIFLRKPSSESTIAASLHKLLSQGRLGSDRPQTAMLDQEVLKEYSDRLISKLEQRNQDLNQMVAELRTSEARLQTVSRRLFEVQEEERRHLARELHDEIGQALTAAKINLKIIAPDVPADVSGRLHDSVELLDRLLRQVRELSLDLRPPLLDELGLVPTLRWLVDQQAQRAGLRVTFNANVDGLEIDPDVQTACFRVAQEAITNVIRHSGANSVAVEVRREAERLTLRVRDDGAGFDPVVIQQRTHDFTLGLVSMKERALLARGGFEVHSAPGQGTEIRAWFPLAPGEHPSAETK